MSQDIPVWDMRVLSREAGRSFDRSSTQIQLTKVSIWNYGEVRSVEPVYRAPINIGTFLDAACKATPRTMIRLPVNKAALRPNQSDKRGPNGKPLRLPRNCALLIRPNQGEETSTTVEIRSNLMSFQMDDGSILSTQVESEDLGTTAE